MTDEGYRCNQCGKEECGTFSKFRYGEEWYTQEEIDKIELDEDMVFDVCDEEIICCGETGEETTMSMIWSTEDR